MIAAAVSIARRALRGSVARSCTAKVRIDAVANAGPVSLRNFDGSGMNGEVSLEK
jgi:hypothetical protein